MFSLSDSKIKNKIWFKLKKSDVNLKKSDLNYFFKFK